MSELKTYEGGCHCKRVRYRVSADFATGIECNCSICGKSGTRLSFVEGAKFELLAGGDELTDYTFNNHHIHHLFCRTCGIKSFARGKGRDGSEMIAINLRCLDDFDHDKVAITQYDGKSA